MVGLRVPRRRHSDSGHGLQLHRRRGERRTGPTAAAQSVSERIHMRASRLNRETLGIPDEKARYAIQRDLVIKKINTLLLSLMRQHGIDMWITLDREYNPDPFSAELGGQGGVRNAHIFFDAGDRLEKVFIFSHPPRQDLAPRLYDEMIH